MKRNRYPITAQLRNGIEKEYNYPAEIRFDVANISYSDSDVVTIGDTKFISGITNGDLVAIFVDKVYDTLSVRDKVVVDIGANIADSAIYFVRRGARKVYAIEPNQELYQLAQKNILLNLMSDRIELIFVGCSSKASKNSHPPFLSLEELFKMYSIVPDVLKLDCEGCEYDIILNANNRLLRTFDVILIEYHYGYRNIIKKLINCGFVVKKLSGPTYIPQNKLQTNAGANFSVSGSELKKNYVNRLYTGYILAERTF